MPASAGSRCPPLLQKAGRAGAWHRLMSPNIITAAGPTSGASQFNVGTQSALGPLRGNAQAGAVSSSNDWGQKFKNHFSDTVISTDTVYKSPNISVELTQGTYDSRSLDYS